MSIILHARGLLKRPLPELRKWQILVDDVISRHFDFRDHINTIFFPHILKTPKYIHAKFHAILSKNTEIIKKRKKLGGFFFFFLIN